MITSQPTSLSSDLLLFNEVFLDEKQQIPILLVSVGPNMALTNNLPHRRRAKEEKSNIKPVLTGKVSTVTMLY
jgi:hypothetical protein